jgi:predicted Zn-dependent protease
MCFFCEINSITKEFETFGSKWGESQVFGSTGSLVSYSFATQNEVDQFGTFDSFIINKSFQVEITTSLSSWENSADIRFVLVPDSAAVDIRFGWRDIDGKGAVLGQATVPSTGGLKSVVVAFDVNEDWFLFGDAPTGEIDFSATAIHEIGHAIGIDHSDSQQALMNREYSTTIFGLQPDDVDAALAIYGSNDILRIDVYRFYNPDVGGHLFTADIAEKASVEENSNFNAEGSGFAAISRDDEEITGSIPVYRFFNTKLGSHFFTAVELEKSHVMTLDNFIYEGVGFRAFNTNSASTVPVHRFFNENSGGHFFTASENEKTAIMDSPQLRYEGEAFYAFADLNI